MLSLVNTFTAMAVDIWKRRPRLANVTGGLSGPAIKPVALHLVSRVYRNIAKSSGTPIGKDSTPKSATTSEADRNGSSCTR